jgi:threonine dehydrogenase-like Zn-dependent dehydrogenase
MRGERWVVAGVGEVGLEAFEVPDAGPGQVRLRTEASLVSAGTELAIFTGIHQGLTNPLTTWPKYPQVMGYMAVGRVEQVGPGVSGFHEGQRLLTSSGHTSHAVFPVSDGSGALCWSLPEEGPAHRLVFARMAKTAATAVARAEITFGQSVVIVGLGIIGQVTLRLFQAAGSWPIVGVDPVKARRDAALRGGAVLAIDPQVSDVSEQLEARLPRGADIVVDATGWASALPGVLPLAREAGKVIVLGSPRGIAQEVEFYRDLHRRSLRLIGAHDSGIGTTIREGFECTNERIVPALVDWIHRGQVPVDDLITHLMPASALSELYQGLLDDKDRYLGAVLDWRER